MKKLLSYLFFISFFMASSCEQEEKVTTEKEIKFSFSPPTPTTSGSLRTNSTPDPVHVLVTIKTAEGRTVADRKELTLYKFGETFLTVPLTLKTSEGTNYKLTEFFVLDENHQVVYVAPREGSELAHLVSDALDIEFAVTKDQITTVTPEVLVVDANVDPSHYGYGQFGFNIVKTVNTVFSSFIKGTSNFELTESHIKIEGLADSTGNDTTALWSYQKNLAAEANKVVIRHANAYRITATKPGYTPKRMTTTISNNQAFEIIFDQVQNNDELWNMSFNQSDWDVCHDSAPTRDGGVIVVSKSLYSSGSYVARLSNDGKVSWKKRYTDYARMGSSLYLALQLDSDDGFILGGNIGCSMIDADKCTQSDSFFQITGWVTKIDGFGNYLWSTHIPNTTAVSKITSSHTSGNIMIFGYREVHSASGVLPQYVLTELNANGGIVWQKSFLQGYNYTTDFNKTQDGYLVSKIYHQSDDVNATIIKHNASGEVQWTNNNLPGNWYNSKVSILETTQGYLVTATQRNVRLPDFSDCTTTLPNGATDVVLAMLSRDGNLQWVKTIMKRTHEKVADSKLLPNGNVLIGGIIHTDCRNNSNYLPRWFFMEVTREGDLITETILAGSRVDTSLGRNPQMYMTSICQINGNEYIVVGNTNILDGDTPDTRKYYRSSSDLWAMKLRF